MALQNNIRRIEWRSWINNQRKTWEVKEKWPVVRVIGRNLTVRPFWWISDYGNSTSRIVFSFFTLSLLFAIIYFIGGLSYLTDGTENIGLVRGLFEKVTPDGVDVTVELHEAFTLVYFIRSIYFSVVTMTTLGFGDIYAMPGSIWGHLLLSFQVILGYVLLGALITRLGIMFTQSGPAATYSKRLESDDSIEDR